MIEERTRGVDNKKLIEKYGYSNFITSKIVGHIKIGDCPKFKAEILEYRKDHTVKETLKKFEITYSNYQRIVGQSLIKTPQEDKEDDIDEYANFNPLSPEPLDYKKHLLPFII